MIRKRLTNLAQMGVVGLTGYCLGIYSERNIDFFKTREDSIIINGKCIKNMPGLPIFGTVSAAAPYSEATGVKDRISQIMKYGFPGLDNVRSFDDYVLSYDRRNRVAHWVFEHLTRAHVAKNNEVDRSKCEFTADESIHPFFRSQNSDYRGSGFDRGHLAAAGNHKLAQKHVEQTFLLTNMAPQVGDGFNRHAWNRLEKHVRGLTKIYDNVYCCTGPLYLPRRILSYRFSIQTATHLRDDFRDKMYPMSFPGTQTISKVHLNQFSGLSVKRKESDGKSYVKYQVIGANSVAVPTHFYKVVVGESAGVLDMEAYVMPNQRIPDETPVANFMVPPESIEKAAGLLFFDKIQRSKLNKINGKKV